jgi:DNA polymerase-3 subunit alpha
LAGDIFGMIERFAGYGFNKAHSAAYAVIGAQTAYLKANFPVEFMAALLSSEIGNTDRLIALMAECRRAGISVLPPCINRSEVEFGVEATKEGGFAVRFGLAAVKNVGEAAVRTIVERREEQPNRRFSSLAAFCDAVDWSAVNRRAADSLAKAGALDDLGQRGGIIAALDWAISAAQKRQRASARGQMDLFGGAIEEETHVIPSQTEEIASRQVLEWEKELLGIYMSDHPLAEVLQQVRRSPDARAIVEIAQLESREVGSVVRLIAMVAGVRHIVTKTNKSMAVAVVEDLSGRIEVVVFPEAFERHGSGLADGKILDVRGRLDRRGEALQIVCESISEDLPCPVEVEDEPEEIYVRFTALADPWSEIRAMQEVDQILQRSEGVNPVVLEVPASSGAVKRLRSRSRRAEWSPQLERDLLSVPGVLGAKLSVAPQTRMAS